MSEQTKAYLEPSLTHREGARIVNVPISHRLGSLLDGLDSFGMSWALFRTCGYAVTVLTKSLCLNGIPVSLAIHHPTWYYSGRSFCAPDLLYLLKGQLLELIARLGHQLPDCQGCQHLMSWDMADSEDCLRLLQVNPNVLPHLLTPQGLIHDHHPSASHCPNHRVNPFRTAKLSVQRVISQGS